MFDKLSEPQIKQRKEKIIQILKHHVLLITVASNATSANFLDMTLSLKPESNQMFRKPNKDPMYTNINSNHPRQKLKKLP